MRRLAIGSLLVVFGLSNFAAGQTASFPRSTLRIALVGQALIHEDLRRVAPLSVEQAKGYLEGADVRFTNLETAVAPKDMAVCVPHAAGEATTADRSCPLMATG